MAGRRRGSSPNRAGAAIASTSTAERGLAGGHESINGSGGSVVLPTVGRNTLRLPDSANLDMRLSRHLPHTRGSAPARGGGGLQPDQPAELLGNHAARVPGGDAGAAERDDRARGNAAGLPECGNRGHRGLNVQPSARTPPREPARPASASSNWASAWSSNAWVARRRVVRG